MKANGNDCSTSSTAGQFSSPAEKCRKKLSTHGLNQNLSSLGCAAEYISLVLLGMQVYAMSSKLFRKNLHNAEGKGESVP